MAKKAEVKNIDRVWNAFMPDGSVLRSAGIADISDQVNDLWGPCEPGYEINWEARAGKFVVSEVESKTKKISKSDV